MSSNSRLLISTSHSNSSLNESNMEKSSVQKQSNGKLPYPVLSDHRDPSSVLILLQKETQTTSKKIVDVQRQIETCEQRLVSTRLNEQEKKTLKYERVKFKQQLDALKKHERRVSLQIDFITTKTEIKGLEDEQKQNELNQNLEQNQQIEILLGKLKQKLDKMKIYMRTRNEQMKKLNNGKSQIQVDRRTSSSSSSSQKQNGKRSLPANHSTQPSGKRQKTPVVRLTSRLTSHESKHPSAPVVRFLNKTTTDSTTINSTSPTTPASSSSTLSPPLIASTSAAQTRRHSEKISSINDDEDVDAEFDMDDLFNDDEDSLSNGPFEDEKKIDV